MPSTAAPKPEQPTDPHQPDPGRPAGIGVVLALLVTLLAGYPTAGADAVPATRPATRPTVGAIRWDAWTGGAITREVERTLAPAAYQHRLPWFATVRGDGDVTIDGSPQAVMDREIDFAADAGLDYWAFLLYPERYEMSAALRQYLASPNRRRIGFCVILHNNVGVPAAQWPAERDRLVALLKEPGYQTVLDGRPLVYAFGLGDGGRSYPADRVADFRRAAKEAGLNPYLVHMGWDPPADWAAHERHGFDAVSAYAHTGDRPSFAGFARGLELGPWRRAADAKVPYVPLVTTGWDKRPRKDHPVSWEKDAAYHRQESWPSTATPGEIAAHLGRGLAFVREHPDVCRANTLVVYAWNEHDEGGWLSPTWTKTGPDPRRLQAVRKVLRGE
ncbi:MAG TPA: hypothetical protein VF796_00475 [Humisphaera sp.]